MRRTKFAAIARGGMQVVARIEIAGEGIERVVECAAVERAEIAARSADRHAADGEPYGLSDRDRGAGDDGEIAVPAAEFPEGIAVPCAPCREMHRLDQFVGLARGRHHADEEILRASRGGACGATTVRLRLSRATSTSGNLRARIGMRDRAADRAAAARLRVSDPRQRRGEQRLALGERQASASNSACRTPAPTRMPFRFSLRSAGAPEDA